MSHWSRQESISFIPKDWELLSIASLGQTLTPDPNRRRFGAFTRLLLHLRRSRRTRMGVLPRKNAPVLARGPASGGQRALPIKCCAPRKTGNESPLRNSQTRYSAYWELGASEFCPWEIALHFLKSYKTSIIVLFSSRICPRRPFSESPARRVDL
jgi:hypothetical protein